MQPKRMDRMLLVAGNWNTSQLNLRDIGEGMNTIMREADNYETLPQNMPEESKTAEIRGLC